ncbi:4-amino-4-deoxy-L-arabinose transferase [Bradyrhizobium sp. KB893862 SZCCT0404]|uniref:4-amino-4-deoxy-L-arabinose transferase n=1 Tax=Bradyrhizobium sp. KB893862 SZCCT0404 TaxID=2807672 RepID=UPI001BAB2E23|nr:4-amino-4-deoxy-L-arabinose transferase [Bradyrhizobium sp. KB893862 SZCCT0404]MBR1179825.1 4-amino-4-deoxy-L-arabinose transferase [Bradyrhizobium sp. KB893862 SZCCT0404]
MDTGVSAEPTTKGGTATHQIHPLIVLLLLAVSVRLPLAFWPNVHHPDEVFQYLEPAWRLLGHDSIVTWEWHEGIRSWLLPTLLAGPVALGNWLAPGGAGAFIAPRVVAALASLSVVVSAWFIGARVSHMHAIVAAFAAAIWFELVHFAPHTLSEPLAAAVILPAAALLTGVPSRKRSMIGGALLALGFVWRFQYAPAIAILALWACCRYRQNAASLVLGGLGVLSIAGMVDVAHGTAPFEWLVLNIGENLLHGRAATFGVAPAIAYVYFLFFIWSGATVLLLCATWPGCRHFPVLLVAALVNLAFHSALEHKEYRFIFLTIPLLIITAALGSADWGVALHEKPGWRPWALPIILGGWAVISVGLAGTEQMREFWLRGTGTARLSAALRADPELCALALYNTEWTGLSGRERLTGSSSLYLFHPEDPMLTDPLPVLMQNLKPAFNRVVARPQTDLPKEFSSVKCAIDTSGDDVCIYARSGSCKSVGAEPFAINEVIVRINDNEKRTLKLPR